MIAVALPLLLACAPMLIGWGEGVPRAMVEHQASDGLVVQQSNQPLFTPIAEAKTATTFPNIAKNFSLDARSAIAIDAKTGSVLWEKNAREARPMASLTKLMTVLVVVDHARLEDTVTISQTAANAAGAQANLRAGEKITVRDLIRLVLVGSANDAATALAEHVGGTNAKFVEMMNAEAKRLGLTKTRFTNPTGLDASGHQSSALDMALTLRALDREFGDFRALSTLPSVRIKAASGRFYTMRATNKLAGLSYVLGGKTGFTNGAGESLALLIRTSANREIITVVLGSGDRFAASKKLAETLRR